MVRPTGPNGIDPSRLFRVIEGDMIGVVDM